VNGLVANDGIREALAPYAALLLLRSGEPASLVEQLLSILARVEPERVAIETYLWNHVVRMHSLHQLIVGAVRTSSERRSTGTGDMDKCNPIIITGMGRSGTTTLTQPLERLGLFVR
jgi:hypothetical protein